MTPGIHSASRKSLALACYRSLLTFALLVSGFTAFPDHRTVFALAVIAFNQAIGSVGVYGNLIFLNQNRLDDLAERKTRHALLLAHDADWRSDVGFWPEVDRRVSQEGADKFSSDAWWVWTGMFLLHMLGYLLCDLVAVSLALFFAG